MYSLNLYCYFVLVFGLLCIGGRAEYTIGNATRIYTSTHIRSLAVLNTAACSHETSLLILTDSTTACMLFTDVNGVVYDQACPAEVVGATDVFCSSVYCYFSNPVSGKIVVYELITHTIARTIDDGNITTPSSIWAAFHFSEFTGGNHEIAIFDAADKSVWYLMIAGSGFPTAEVVSTKVGTIASSGAPVGISKTNTNGQIIAAVAHDTTVWTYQFVFNGPTNYYWDPVPFPISFGDVGCLGGDYYARTFVYDYTCACTKVYAPKREEEGHFGILNTTLVPKLFRYSRDNIFVLDSQGINRFGEKLKVTVVSVEDKKCDNLGGKIEVSVISGAFPVQYLIYPGGKTTAPTEYYEFNTSAVFKNVEVLPAVYPAYIFNETQSNNFDYIEQNARISLFHAEDLERGISPYNGEYVLGLQFENGNGVIDIKCYSNYDCFNARLNLVEFYINVGAGGQKLQVDFIDTRKETLQTYSIRPGDHSLFDWSLVSIPLNFSKQWSTMRFTDVSGAAITNYTFIDMLAIFPDSDPYHHFEVVDFCYQKYTSKQYLFTNNKTMSAQFQTVPVTCNAAQPINGALTRDGSVNVTVANAVPPLTYIWAFPDANLYQNQSEVKNLAALHNYITIYDNAVNSTGWYDSSILLSGNPYDSTFYHSAPYSYSMPIPTNGDALSLQFTHRGLLTYEPGAQLTFWVNGGIEGGQSISMNILRYSAVVASIEDIRMLLGVATIQPNMWMKVVYEISSSVTEFTSVQLVANGLKGQNTIYFDDFELNLTPALMVLDDAGCQITLMDISVAAPPPLVLAPLYANAMCFNSTDGVMELNVQGGVAPYEYKWQITGANINRTSTLGSLEDLKESVVRVDVTDHHGCKTSQLVYPILQPPPLGLAVSVEPIKCYGQSATLFSYMYGGSAPYTYAWSSASKLDIIAQPAPSPIFTDSFSVSTTNVNISVNARPVCLGTGSHLGLNYLPTHSGYCSISATFNTSYPSVVISGLSISSSRFDKIGFWVYLQNATDAQNLAVSLGKAGVQVSAPRSVYELANATIAPGSWNQIIFNITGLSDPNPNQIVFTSSTPQSMGRVLFDDLVLIPKVASSVGVGVYSGYKSILTGNAGLYFLTVVDGNGCSFLHSINISQPEELSVETTIVGASSSSAKDGSIEITGTGGYPPYSFLWLDTNTTGTSQSDLAYGAKRLQITDANGCVQIITINIPLEERLTLRKFNNGLSAGLGVVAAIGISVGVVAFIVMLIFSKTHSKLGGLYNTVITIGVILGNVSVVVLLPRPTDALCTAFPWLLGTAFTLVYSCLFLKTWALYQVWTKAINYKKSTLTATKIIRTLVIALLIEFILLAIWTAVDRPKVHKVEVVNDQLEEQCNTKHPTFWILFITFKGIWLIFGAVMSVLTRNVMKEYNESANIAYAIYNILILMVIAIPLASLLDVVPGGRLVIEVVVPVLAFTSTLVIMYFKLWHTTIFGTPDVKIPGARGGSGGSGGDKSKSTSNNAQNSKEAEANVAQSKREETHSSVFQL